MVTITMKAAWHSLTRRHGPWVTTSEYYRACAACGHKEKTQK